MARPREFDLDDVIDQAMHVFWAKGFHATSLDDICAATRLNRSSLYSVFNDKRALFLRTIDRYGEREAARVVEALSRPVTVDIAITTFFAELVEQMVAGRGRRGCLIGNAAVEVAVHDDEIGTSVSRNLDRVEAAFRHALTRAKTRSELSEQADVGALARFFVAGTQGLRLIGKTTSNRQALEDIAGQIVRALKRDD
jgi:TetR/AcrR family transcriptional repressor of nem operon